MKKKIRRLKKLYQKMYMDKWTAFVIVVLCLATAAMHVEISLMLEPMINKSLEVQSIAWRETAVFLGCSVIFILLKFFRKMMFAASCCKSELKWNQIAMDWLNAYGMQALENVREGEVAAVISKRIRDFQEFLETHLEGIIYIPLDFFLTFLAVFFIDYRTGLIILPVIAFGIFVDIRLSDKLVKSSKRAYDAENNVLSFQKEVVENAENIILSGMARYVIDRHTALINSKLEADNRLTAEQQYSYIPALINEYMPTIVLVVIAVYKISHDGMGYGEFIALLSLVSGASLPFAHFLRSLSELKAIEPLLDEMGKLSMGMEQAGTEIRRKDEKGKEDAVVEVKNLTFHYKNTEKAILEKLNFRVFKGEKVAFIGRSGIGKTTLLKLVLGIIPPDDGEIKMFGQKVKWNPKDVWEKVGYVDNNCYLFDGSVTYNITLKNEELSYEEECCLNEICTRLKIRDILKETEGVQQFGKNLSGGQRLKVCLARALFRKPELLILDEPSASFDQESEDALCEILNDSSVTAIISTHRKRLLSVCDKIFQMEDNGVSESGQGLAE